MQNFFRKYIWFLFLPLTLVYMEAALRIWCFGEIAPHGLVCALPLTLAAGFLMSFMASLGRGKSYRVITTLLLVALFLFYGTHAVYYKIFSTFLTLFSMSGAVGVFGSFWREALEGIWRSMPILLAMLYPMAVWLLLRKRITPPETSRRLQATALTAFITLQVVGVMAVRNLGGGVMAPSYLYYDAYVPELSMSWFGAVTNLRLDIKELSRPEVENSPISEVVAEVEELISPAPTETPEPVSTPEPTPEPTPVEYPPNVMEIDFDSLIEGETNQTVLAMHEYFSEAEPTAQNEYTGLFEGKNLVWIVAEGFSSWALDESCTPTLCKLAKSGFVFENYYNPVWGVSTSDGEYTAMTGLLPKSGVWSYSKSGRNYMPFGFGNQMNALGYASYAFHDGSLTYYDRDVSHPNMGYDFRADGAGLDIESVWPPSDLEMIDETTGLYLGNGPFNVYYMTISGHMYYTFSGNMMAAKHEQDVAELPYSANCRAYIASLMETDLAVELLLERLEEAGELDNTVIVFSGDHYPYALEKSEIDELNGSEVEGNFELYRSTLAVWCADMDEPVYVDKYCSAIDILPTLSNLFGVEYDSRLLMGRDALSDSPALVVFQNHSFITDYGRYNAASDVYTPNPGCEELYGADYARETLSKVNEMFTMSANILDHDYYSAVFSND